MDKMVEDAIVEVLNKLDPHSVYISKEDVRAMNEPLEGNFEGIGVEFNIMNDTLMVVNPVPGGPSERVGIVAGDRIIVVDGKPIAGIGIKNSDVFKLLRGPKGTNVMVSVLRKGSAKPLEFKITRDRIPIYSVDASYMVTPKIGYIKLNRFSLTTEKEFLDALETLRKSKMEDLVLDLRGNGGGFLNAAVALADHFLSAGKLIVYTEGRNNPRTDFFSTNIGQYKKGRLIILVDEGSASASEIVAGAVQDWDRGIIIGRRSFGKGLVQNQMPLPDGSMLRLTVARYHTPTGRVIQKPYSNGNFDDYYKDLTNRLQKGELYSTDKISLPDSLKYLTLVKKKTVFGGGGIMPDLFVPIDTSFYTPFYGKLVRRGVLNQFILNYVDANRKQIKKNFPDFEKFNAGFRVDKKILEEFLAFADKQGVPTEEEGLKTSEEEIKMQLKALLAQNLFSTSHYFQVINQRNNALLQAVEVLQNWNYYSPLIAE
jgi:carboxyl-terminal processing protease